MNSFSNSTHPVIQMSDGSVYIDGENYPLPEQVIQNIETVIGMQTRQAQTVPIHVRFLRKVAAAFGTAKFLYALLLFFAVWISWSYLIAEPLR